ncbi:MAG: sigma-70 family RNA polymerase sigma factor [bacterium]
MTERTDEPNQLYETEDREREREEERALFARYIADPTQSNEELIVEKFKPLVYRIVHKFKYQPDQFDDLVQVGSYGLLLAVRRFDLEYNYRFSTYAWQTIQGEIQRYFRDKTWALNVPRDLKERSLKVFNTVNELNANSEQEPTVAEIATKTGFSEEQVLEAMELGSAYHPQSFKDNERESDISFSMSDDGAASASHDLNSTKRGIFWESILSNLTETESKVIKLYFFEQKTQKEIADILVTSQMNVSRLTRKALGKLRGMLAPEDLENLAM